MLFGKKKKEDKVDKKTVKKADVKQKAETNKSAQVKSVPKQKSTSKSVKDKEKSTSVTKKNSTLSKNASAPAEKKTATKKSATSTKTNIAPAKKNASAPTEVKAGIYRVVYDKTDREWKIKRDGAKRIIDSRSTKEEALARVKELSESNDVGFVVYKRDGKFQKK